jgi:hypothetical protein
METFIISLLTRILIFSCQAYQHFVDAAVRCTRFDLDGIELATVPVEVVRVASNCP